MLAWYAREFQTVELNNTFYRLPPENAVSAWRDTVPPDFRFAVKGSRFITHMKKLKDPVPALDRFFQRADLLAEKMGPILFQLPPHWGCDPVRFEAFLEALPKGNAYAFEFRDPDWHQPVVCDLLRRFNAAWCIYDLAGFQSPRHVTADFTYVRLHGPGNAYQGSYPVQDLEKWLRQIQDWNLSEAWVFFDNDQAAYAVENARQMQELLR
ncbi:MAG: hypothetical protein JWN34_100 [Bryobacterales bacterium]|nr:hypothetical protein [Bryobacterales bacterium]